MLRTPLRNEPTIKTLQPLEGFSKTEQTDETILYEGLLKRGMRMVPILALLTNEASPKGHSCAGCRTGIPHQTERVTTRLLGSKRPGDYSDHHHWHPDCFEQSAQNSHNEHSLKRWSIAARAVGLEIEHEELLPA
jgi:hypothetical protein